MERLYTYAENTFWWAWLIDMLLMGVLFLVEWLVNWDPPAIALIVIVGIAIVVLTAGGVMAILNVCRAFADATSWLHRQVRKISPMMA